MCGRTACTLSPEILCKACCYKNSSSEQFLEPELKECDSGNKIQLSYNFSPTMYSPVLISKKLICPESLPEERIILPMMWGMIPPWHTGTPTKHGLSTNNCRLEGITEKKLYREPLNKGNRCVILCDGFYEWKPQGKAVKQPYFISFPQIKGISITEKETWEERVDSLWSKEDGWKGPKPLQIAGLFNTWKNPQDGSIIYSYSVITMESSSAVSWIHERMPAILDTDEEVANWLDSYNFSVKKALSNLKASVNLCVHPVSTAVNNVRNQDRNLNQAIDLNKPKPLSSSGKLMANWLIKGSDKPVRALNLKDDPDASASKKTKLEH